MDTRELVILSIRGTSQEDLDKIAKAIGKAFKGKYQILVTNKELHSFSKEDLLALVAKLKEA